jgi:hypothetical protein
VVVDVLVNFDGDSDVGVQVAVAVNVHAGRATCAN